MREGLNGARNSIVSSRAAIANAHEAMRQTQLRMASARERVAGTRLGQLPESRGIEQLFLSVITASAPLVGEAYFEKIPKIIADAWGGAAFLTRLDRAGSCRFLGITGLEEREPPANLTGQPWLGDGTSAAIYYPLNAGASFPDDPLLAGVETYLAVPLFDAAGTRVGYVGILDTRRWAAGEAAAAESLLRLVAPRAAAEVEREELHDRLSIELRNFAELATETGDGFVSWIAGETPRSVYVNRSALRMLGCEERDVTSDPGVLSRIVAAASEGDEGANRRTGVLLVRRNDGREAPVDVRLTIDAECAGGPMYRCILRETVDARASSSEDVMLAAVLRKLPFAAIVVQDDDVEECPGVVGIERRRRLHERARRGSDRQHGRGASRSTCCPDRPPAPVFADVPRIRATCADLGLVVGVFEVHAHTQAAARERTVLRGANQRDRDR